MKRKRRSTSDVALPKTWPEGEVRAQSARGGYTVGVRWQNGKLLEAIIRSAKNSTARIRVGSKVRSFTFTRSQTIRVNGVLQRLAKSVRPLKD